MDKKQKKNFPPGYFEKPEEKKWYVQHAKSLGIAAIFVIICILLSIIFIPRGCTNDKDQIIDTLVTDTITNESVSQIVVEDSISLKLVETTPVNTEVENVKSVNSLPETSRVNDNNATKNELVKVSEDIEKEALSVIRGNYGNNPERRRLLKDRYQEIQNKVNEMYRNGLVR